MPERQVPATSRRPLRLSGEDVIVVPPLSVPDEGGTAAPEPSPLRGGQPLRGPRHLGSLRLPGDARQRDSRGGLCRDLDGMPLAIELAAARVRVMSPEEICDGLSERLQVLTTGYRDAADRHGSLRACVEWSYQLCTDPEQKFWARSSVFTGGFDLAAAAAVCAAEDLPAGEILDLVGGLVDQSIVSPRTTAPAIRGTGCSPTSGSSVWSGQRRTASSMECRSGTPPGARSWSPFRAPRRAGRTSRTGFGCFAWRDANLRAALGYVTGSAEGAAAGLVMARKLDLYWSACGFLDEARHWLELALATGAGTPEERALAMAVAARFAVLQHDRARASGAGRGGDRGGHSVGDTEAIGLLLLPAPCSRSGTAPQARLPIRPTRRCRSCAPRPTCQAS